MKMYRIMAETDKSCICLEEKRRYQFTCPVCGKLIGDMNLPTQENIIEEKLREEGITFPNFALTMAFESCHIFDGNEKVLDDVHPISFAIDIVYDSAGKCITFEVVGVNPCR